MAQYNITINNAIAADVVSAYCKNYGYQDIIMNSEGLNVPNPETKSAFTKRMILEGIKENVIRYKREQQVGAITVPDPDITIS